MKGRAGGHDEDIRFPTKNVQKPKKIQQSWFHSKTIGFALIISNAARHRYLHFSTTENIKMFKNSYFVIEIITILGVLNLSVQFVQSHTYLRTSVK